MEMKYIPETACETYQLAPGDMNHVFRRSGLLGNKLSPFRYSTEQAAQSKPSSWFLALSEAPFFLSIAKLLLEPDLKILFHHGGNAAKQEQFYTFLTADEPYVLALFFESQEAYQLLFFSDWENYLQWWARLFSTDGSPEYEQVFRDKDEIETLVCALQCVDYYRRANMESMLDFQNGVDISLHTHDFVQLLKTSLASADTRWLLPSLFELTPGLKNLCLALKPEHLRSIAELKFVSCSQDLIMTMGERSQKMGTEFLMSWREAIGWQATALIKDEERALSHVFMAPTAMANHLLSFETGANKESRFRHQALTRQDLIETLINWVAALRELADRKTAAAAVEVPEESTVLPPQELFFSTGSAEEPSQAEPEEAENLELTEPHVEHRTDVMVPEPAEISSDVDTEEIPSQAESYQEEVSYENEADVIAEYIPEPAPVPEVRLWPQPKTRDEDIEPLTLLYHEPEPEPQKKRCSIVSVLLIILLLVLGGTAFFWWSKNRANTSFVIPLNERRHAAVLITDDGSFANDPVVLHTY